MIILKKIENYLNIRIIEHKYLEERYRTIHVPNNILNYLTDKEEFQRKRRLNITPILRNNNIFQETFFEPVTIAFGGNICGITIQGEFSIDKEIIISYYFNDIEIIIDADKLFFKFSRGELVRIKTYNELRNELKNGWQNEYPGYATSMEYLGNTESRIDIIKDKFPYYLVIGKYLWSTDWVDSL